ncbi:MAG: hypothetical protein PHC40_04765, partial [Eubacteriales bacterium]|nr:hypothetical protein [Eubacteriales bacterium]
GRVQLQVFYSGIVFLCHTYLCQLTLLAKRQTYLPRKPLVLRMCMKLASQAIKGAFSNSDGFYGK